MFRFDSRPTRSLAFAVATRLAAAFSAAVAQPIPTFQFLELEEASCLGNGQFSMRMLASNVEEDGTLVRTRVQVGSSVYMNELALPGVVGTEIVTWGVFDNFSYGIVPNRGVDPIPEGAMRLDFTVERPKGVVRSAWALEVDGCATGNVLLSGEPVFADGFEVDGTSAWSETIHF